jgi:hypothetical protein
MHSYDVKTVKMAITRRSCRYPLFFFTMILLRTYKTTLASESYVHNFQFSSWPNYIFPPSLMSGKQYLKKKKKKII